MNVYRGDIFYIQQAEYNAPTEPELRPGRPAVVVSSNAANSSAPYVTVVYLTTQEKPPLPTHAGVFCKQPSTALCEQVYTVMKNRIGTYVRTCSAEEMQGIDTALLAQFGINARDVTDDENRKLLEEMKGEQAALKAELREAEQELVAENTKLRAERDMLRGLYVQLLDRLVEGPKQ